MDYSNPKTREIYRKQKKNEKRYKCYSRLVEIFWALWPLMVITWMSNININVDVDVDVNVQIEEKNE